MITERPLQLCLLMVPRGAVPGRRGSAPVGMLLDLLQLLAATLAWRRWAPPAPP